MKERMTERIIFAVGPELKGVMEKEAEDRGVSVSSFIRSAIIESLSEGNMDEMIAVFILGTENYK